MRLEGLHQLLASSLSTHRRGLTLKTWHANALAPHMLTDSLICHMYAERVIGHCNQSVHTGCKLIHSECSYNVIYSLLCVKILFWRNAGANALEFIRKQIN